MPEAVMDLSTLHAGQRLRGMVPGQVVTVVAVDPIDDGLVEVFYRDENGQSGAHMVTGADAAAFTEVSAEDSAPAFDADPDESAWPPRARVRPTSSPVLRTPSSERWNVAASSRPRAARPAY